MAITGITARGSASVGTGSNASLPMNPTANITVGKIAFVNCFTDNFQTTDGVSDRHSVADSVGNTWNKIAEYTETDGAADDGVTVSMWWSKITTQIGTGDTITITPVSSQSDMIITCFEATVGAGNVVAVENIGVGQGTLTTSLSSLPSREYLFIYAAASEGEDAAKTPATNYTEQFDLVSSTSGALDANVCCHVTTRVQTTTTSGSVASSAWTGTNFMSLLAAVYESADLSPSPITGSTAGSSSVTSTLIGIGELTSSTAGTTTVSSVLVGHGILSGQATGVGTASGTLSDASSSGDPISGETDGITVVTSILTGKGILVGTIAGISTNSSVLGGTGTLIGGVTGGTTLSSILKGKGSMSGQTGGIGGLSGLFMGAQVQPKKIKHGRILLGFRI